MKTLTEALDFLAAQPDVGKYLGANGFNGPRYDSMRCPVAKYLNAQGLEDVYVGGRWAIARGQEETEIPLDVQIFISRYDHQSVATSQQLYGLVAL